VAENESFICFKYNAGKGGLQKKRTCICKREEKFLSIAKGVGPQFSYAAERREDLQAWGGGGKGEGHEMGREIPGGGGDLMKIILVSCPGGGKEVIGGKKKGGEQSTPREDISTWGERSKSLPSFSEKEKLQWSKGKGPINGRGKRGVR